VERNREMKKHEIGVEVEKNQEMMLLVALARA
jgi:hypothetical protein